MDIKEQLKQINLAEFCNKHYGTTFNIGEAVPTSCCMFHDDNKPSMTYYANSNSVICWTSCYADRIGVDTHKPLDIFQVVALQNNLNCKDDFPEVIKIICEMEGIQYSYKAPTKEQMQLYEYKTNLADLYIKNLRDIKNSNHIVHAYLINDRGLSKQTVSDFFLGLTRQNEAKFGIAQMSNRVSIPILSDDGKKVIEITGRQITHNEAEPKYKHGKTDAIWKKSKVLYAYSHAKKFCRESNFTYVVEGFFDVMSMHQIGLKNTVSIMSNMITEDQAKKLKTLSKNVTFIIDQDKAGLDSFLNNMKICMSVGLDVKVIPFLDYLGKDMNDVCIKLNWDSNKIKKLLEDKVQDGILYSLNPIYQEYDNKILEAKRISYNKVADILSLIQDEDKRLIYKRDMMKKLDL